MEWSALWMWSVCSVVDTYCNHLPSFRKIQLSDQSESKTITATSLKLMVPFPEMGPLGVLVLNQCVTCQSHQRSAREQTSDVEPKLQRRYRWMSIKTNKKIFLIKLPRSLLCEELGSTNESKMTYSLVLSQFWGLCATSSNLWTYSAPSYNWTLISTGLSE